VLVAEHFTLAVTETNKKESELILWFNLLSTAPIFMLAGVKFQIFTEVPVFRMG